MPKIFWARNVHQKAYLSLPITASELLHGWERAPTGKKKQARKRFVEAILSTYPILDFDLNAARQHAHLWAFLEKQGKIIGAHDLLIATICLPMNYEIGTLNIREFQQVPGLKLKPTQKYVIP